MFLSSLLVLLCSAQDLPTAGRYFFADFYPGDIYGRHYLDLHVGSQRYKMPVWVTTTESITGLITTNCRDECQVPRKWDQTQSNSRDIKMQTYHAPYTDVFEGRSLGWESFSGSIVNDFIIVSFNQTH